jgi:hypothetical protein
MPLCRERYLLGREVGTGVQCLCPWIQFVPSGVVVVRFQEKKVVSAFLSTISPSPQLV